MSQQRSRLILVLIGLAMALFLLGSIVVLLLYGVKQYTNKSESWSIIVDAGSTASKLYLYRWNKSVATETSDILQVGEKQDIKTPISSYTEAPSLAATDLATTILNKEPFVLLPDYLPDKGPNLFLGATAGMRMLSHSNPNASNAIMSSLQHGLSGNKTRFQVLNPVKDVKIISGVEEGYFAWITANYIKGVFNSDSSSSTNNNRQGILDLGGASTQISFVLSPEDAKNDNFSQYVTHKVIFQKSFDIYAYSYLCFGKTQANYRMIAKGIQMANFKAESTSPCLPLNTKLTVSAEEIFQAPCINGKFALDAFGEEFVQPPNSPATYSITGTGNSQQCLASSVAFFFNSSSFSSIPKPKITGKFMAFAGYYYTIANAGLNSTIDFALLNEKISTVCPGDGVARNVTVNDRTVWNCFDLIYVRELLTGYGFDSNTIKDVQFINEVNGQSVGWSIGFMLDQTSQLHEGLPIVYRIISTPVFATLFILFCLFFIVCVMTFFFILSSNRRIIPFKE